MALVTMYDAVSPGGIPTAAQAVAGYVDGRYRWSDADWGRFSGAAHVTITVLGAAGVRVCDCETGDLTPEQAAAWAAAEVQAGRRPTVYCNTSTMPAVQSALSVFALSLGDQVDWWAAQYDGVAELAPLMGVTPVAKQYAGSPGNSPGPYDLSVCDPAWLGVPAPSPPAPSNVSGGCDMGTVCRIARPSALCPPGESVDDWLYVLQGRLYFCANAPYFTPGQGEPLNAQIEVDGPDGNPVAMAKYVTGGWDSALDALVVAAIVPNVDLKTASVFVNACPASKLGPNGFGGWVKQPFTADLG